jgi:hypothetical protein
MHRIKLTCLEIATSGLAARRRVPPSTPSRGSVEAVEVRQSDIQGEGLFACRKFKVREVVATLVAPEVAYEPHEHYRCTQFITHRDDSSAQIKRFDLIGFLYSKRSG